MCFRTAHWPPCSRDPHLLHRLLFLPAPFVFCLSHFLILEPTSSWGAALACAAGAALCTPAPLDATTAIGAAPAFTRAFRTVQSAQRFRLFAMVYGLFFGLLHSMLVCQPAILYGRRALPTIQSLFWVSTIIGTIFGQIAVGWAHDAYGSYSAALVTVTLGASALCFVASSYLGWTRPFSAAHELV